MHGGYRQGAGRKPLNQSQKKKNRNIYITDNLYDEIMSVNIDNSKSFSERCRFLIQESLSEYEKESEDNRG